MPGKLQLNRNMYHFKLTNFYLFNVNSTSFNKIYSVVFETSKFENCLFKSQITSAENWLPFVLTAVDRAINETTETCFAL